MASTWKDLIAEVEEYLMHSERSIAGGIDSVEDAQVAFLSLGKVDALLQELQAVPVSDRDRKAVDRVARRVKKSIDEIELGLGANALQRALVDDMIASEQSSTALYLDEKS